MSTLAQFNAALLAVSASSAWGGITGTLADQTDLATALAAKAVAADLTSEVTARATADTALSAAITAATFLDSSVAYFRSGVSAGGDGSPAAPFRGVDAQAAFDAGFRTFRIGAGVTLGAIDCGGTGAATLSFFGVDSTSAIGNLTNTGNNLTIEVTGQITGGTVNLSGANEGDAGGTLTIRGHGVFSNVNGSGSDNSTGDGGAAGNVYLSFRAKVGNVTLKGGNATGGAGTGGNGGSIICTFTGTEGGSYSVSSLAGGTSVGGSPGAPGTAASYLYLGTGTGLTLPGSGTLATTGDNLGVFGTTSATQFFGTMVNFTGSGGAVRAISPALTTPDLGTPTACVGTNFTGNAASFTVGTATKLGTPRALYGSNFDGSAAITGPITGTYGGTGVNNGSFQLTIPATGTAALLGTAQTFSAANTFTGTTNTFTLPTTTGSGSTAGIAITANSLTTGTGVDISSTSASSTAGSVVRIAKTGAGTLNKALELTASGGTTNTALNVTAGFSTLQQVAATRYYDSTSSGYFVVSSSGDIQMQGSRYLQASGVLYLGSNGGSSTINLSAQGFTSLVGGITLGSAVSCSGTLAVTGASTLGGAAAGSTTATKITKTISSIADNTATDVLTVTVPNGAHAGTLTITLTGALGTGGSVGACEASATAKYLVDIARFTGVNAVATASPVIASPSSVVASGATITVTAAVSSISGAVGASNTFTIKVTIAKGSGSSANHTCLVVAEIANANATGITIA